MQPDTRIEVRWFRGRLVVQFGLPDGTPIYDLAPSEVRTLIGRLEQALREVPDPPDKP